MKTRDDVEEFLMMLIKAMPGDALNDCHGEPVRILEVEASEEFDDYNHVGVFFESLQDPEHPYYYGYIINPEDPNDAWFTEGVNRTRVQKDWVSEWCKRIPDWEAEHEENEELRAAEMWGGVEK